MNRLLTHDAIANGIFNLSYSGGGGVLQPWDRALTNSVELLDCLVDRMQMDFETASPKLRKPWGLRELEFQPHLVHVG